MLNLKNYEVCVILTWSIYCFITLFPALHSDLESQSHNRVTVKNGRLRSHWRDRQSQVGSPTESPTYRVHCHCLTFSACRTQFRMLLFDRTQDHLLEEKKKENCLQGICQKKKISSDCVTSQTKWAWLETWRKIGKCDIHRGFWKLWCFWGSGRLDTCTELYARSEKTWEGLESLLCGWS